MTKLNPNYGNKAKSDILSLVHIEILHNIFYEKILKYFPMSFKFEISQFYE